MKIVLVNDDGIDAKGIRFLAKKLHQKYELTIVAPATEQSGKGHAISTKTPLIITPETCVGQGIPAYRVEGSPADCVAIACNALMLAPDVIISGINSGFNLGADIFYSGTVSAAIEGALMGITSIAISAASFEDKDLSISAKVVLKLLSVLQLGNHPALYNVNVPTDPVGATCAVLSNSSCSSRMGRMEKRQDPRGRIYYWRPIPQHSEEQWGNTDRAWNKKRYITITPLNIDLTKQESMPEARMLSSTLMTS